MAKKITAPDPDPILKQYIAIDIIGSPDGSRRWMHGALLELSDAQALPLLEKGSIEPGPSNTNPPQPPPPLVEVIEAGQSAAMPIAEQEEPAAAE